MTAATIPPVFKTINRLSFLLLLITYLCFIILGMSDMMRDVAMLSIRVDFNKPVEVTGVLAATSTIGYMLASFYSGQIISRLGIGLTLALSCGLRALALASFAFAPSWETLLLASGFVGLGGGMVDSGTNIYVAANYGSTAMFWLHAAFGIGASLGPLMMTVLIERLDQSWQVGYLVAASLYLGLVVIFASTLRYWSTSTTAAGVTAKITAAPMLRTLRLPVVWFSILIFILYTGTEVAASLWGLPLLAEARGIDRETAGYWITIYWTTFTVGRIAAGFITRWITEAWYMRLSLAGAVIGAGLFWWNPAPIFSLIGLAALGFGLAPVFPALISSTEKRVSPEHTANTIGFMVAGAGLGVAIVPNLTGVLARQFSLEIVPVVLFVASIVMFGLYELLLRNQRR